MLRCQSARRVRRPSRPLLLERLEGRVVPSFVAPRAFDTGATALSVAVGEFNGDGRPDLATANPDGVENAGTVSVLLGNVDGTFQAARIFPVGLFPTSVAVGEFNGDGRQDLAVANAESDTVSVLLGNGDGTFQAARNFPTGPSGSYPNSVAVGEFNGDSRLDLAVAEVNNNTVSVFLGNGDGTFRGPTRYDIGADRGPYFIAVGEFNGDSRQDLVTANIGGSEDVSVLLGNGDGTFQAARNFFAGFGPQTVAVGEFNGDSRQDLAVGDIGFGSSVRVFLGNGDGTFQAPRGFHAATSPYAVAVGDVNGDGRQDLAATGTGTVCVLLGRGDGSFQGARHFPVGSGPFGGFPWSVAVGEFNGDGRPDLATANSESDSLSVLLGTGDGSFQPARDFPAGPHPVSVAVGEFNGDGRMDLAVTNVFNTVSVLLGNGDGTFQAARAFPVGLYPSSVAVGDTNGDGRLDLVVANYGSDDVSVLLGNGDGTFQAARNLPAGGGPSFVVVRDVNNDTRRDLVVANYGTNNLSVLLGNGDGTFQAARNFPAGVGPSSVAVGDVNNDGRLDLAVANYSFENGAVSVLLGSGDGTFQGPRTFPTGGTPWSVAVSDFNVDGLLDLAVANGLTVRVLFGYGDGTFQTPHVSYVAGGEPRSVAVADFDGGGGSDLAVANPGSGDVSVLLNDATWPRNPVAHFYIYSDLSTVTAGVPFDLAVFALDASFERVLGYTGEILFVTTDPQATTPGTYRFRLQDGGLALFPNGVTFRTPGRQALAVLDTATFSVFGFAVFDVQAPHRPGGGGTAPGPVLDVFLTEALAGGRRPTKV